MHFVEGVCNTGIALSIPAPQAVILFFSVIGIGIMIREMLRLRRKPLLFFGFLLLLYGACSNMIERWHFGCVHDFIALGNEFPVFNVADVCISLGALLVYFGWWRAQELVF
jgi:signal peptidase II